jgi:hypothetical protein
MAHAQTTILDLFDARPLVDASRLRVGNMRARGVPAVLIGVATIVFAAGCGEALKRAATALPETLRETRNTMLMTRSARELPRPN